MPLSCRTVEPVLVSQVKVPPDVDDELAFVVNATLANFIRQIANLSLRAADIFAELSGSIETFAARTEKLECKVTCISDEIEQLGDPTDIKPLVNTSLNIYKTDNNRDDDLIDHTQMPDCIKEMFNEAQEPPELFKFDEFRQNGEESMRFYTDPDFFLREWLKNARNERKKKNEKKKKKRNTVIRETMQQPSFPPPMMINTVVQEPVVDNSTMDYNFGDVAVYEDPALLRLSKDFDSPSNFTTEAETGLQPMAPPPPILAIYPTCLPPAPPPAQPLLKAPEPTIKNLLADIQRGPLLKPVAQRQETKEKTRDFRELIQELRPAWENNSDESDDSDE